MPPCKIVKKVDSKVQGVIGRDKVIKLEDKQNLKKSKVE